MDELLLNASGSAVPAKLTVEQRAVKLLKRNRLLRKKKADLVDRHARLPNTAFVSGGGVEHPYGLKFAHSRERPGQKTREKVTDQRVHFLLHFARPYIAMVWRPSLDNPFKKVPERKLAPIENESEVKERLQNRKEVVGSLHYWVRFYEKGGDGEGTVGDYPVVKNAEVSMHSLEELLKLGAQHREALTHSYYALLTRGFFNSIGKELQRWVRPDSPLNKWAEAGQVFDAERTSSSDTAVSSRRNNRTSRRRAGYGATEAEKTQFHGPTGPNRLPRSTARRQI